MFGMKNVVINKCNNGLVQIELRDSIITVAETIWTACLAKEEGDKYQAAMSAERNPKAIVVRF